ncbi:hypothetical protein KI387_027500, partial [Taxus chinensis]
METEAVEALKEGKIGEMPLLCLSILSHSATGGFLSHCGWNSTVECDSYGFPIIGWPLFAEQRLNRFMLVNRNKIAIDLKLERDWFVRRGEVERAVRALTEGEEGITARESMRKMKENEMPKIRT